ncbi:MAG: DUF2062 domain-containing protein [Bdellovibrio sp.]|nr:MAG: DUF2062 domain-containing protein [Bdellovibrio sp.]
MTLLLKQIFAFFRMLNSETATNQLAWGFSLGMILGFSPILSLQAVIVFLLVFFFRVQLGATLLSAFFFKFVAYFLDPVSDQLGRVVLESEGLRPLFTQLYNMPFVPLTRFNNSIVMGSGLMGFLLSLPGFFVFRYLVLKYRATFVARFKQTKLWKLWVGTSFYKWYATYNSMFG